MVLILSSAFVFSTAKIRFISLIYNFLHIILLKKIDKIRDKGADFVIELKANQRSLRYGLEDSIKTATPTDVYKVHTWNTAGLSQGYAVYTVGKNLLSTRKNGMAI